MISSSQRRTPCDCKLHLPPAGKQSMLAAPSLPMPSGRGDQRETETKERERERGRERDGEEEQEQYGRIQIPQLVIAMRSIAITT